MKKILSLCAVVLTAMSMSATVTNMTCAEAKNAALALADGATGTDTVCVTGYVTYTNGTVSKGQQVFYMDDTKGTTQTFQAYWCNLPDANAPLNVGDKVAITGLLMNYYKSSTDTHTAEMKNGNVAIIERAVVKIDTIDSDVCETIGEALTLNNNEYSTDFFHITGLVTSANDANTTYNNQTFYFACIEGTNDGQTLDVYQAGLMADSQAVVVGDTVEVVGKLCNYNSQAEMTAAKVLSIKKSSLVVDTIDVTVGQAVTTAMLLANSATSSDYYRITGYIDSIATAYSESYDNISFYMTDDIAKPTYNFEGYRVKGGSDLKVGDKIVLTGRLYHYYSAATESAAEKNLAETPAGATYKIISSSALDEVESENGVEKVMMNGVLYIRKDGELFTVTGIKL